MTLRTGSRLGPYEILSAIGAGGMGEVYRARDSKLGRDVAIKVLPQVFTTDPDRLARFQREARLLASLDHPNIASIYGLEDSDGTRALVMQLVEGPTLADRIRQGPIPLDEALRIAKQICEALEYAHERGIVHRDLKPSNDATNEKLILSSSNAKVPSDWSRDGRFVLYQAQDPKTKEDIWVVPLERSRKPFPFLRTEFDERDGHFSPDGHWVAYVSDESGRREVYVRPFSHDLGAGSPATGGEWLISTNGGDEPRWRGDGKELYYMAADGKMMAVDISAGSTFHAGVPQPLFEIPLRGVGRAFPPWDVTSDGKRFLFVGPGEETAETPFTFVLNWTSLLTK